YRAQADLHRELRAIATPRVEVKASAHAANLRGGDKLRAELVMTGTIAFRYQELDLLADELVAPVSEEFFGLMVGLDDSAREIDGHHGIRNCGEEFLRDNGVSERVTRRWRGDFGFFKRRSHPTPQLPCELLYVGKRSKSKNSHVA